MSKSEFSERLKAVNLRKEQPLGVQIADQLRRDILFGYLSPDVRITQDDICERFGTSRVPVRDALQSLLHQGILEQTSAGIRAVRLSDSDLSDMFQVEGVLHSLATRLATERATESQLAELDAINQTMRETYLAEDFAGLARANATFHRRVNYIADSPRLVAALRVATLKIHGEFLEHFPRQSEGALEDHRAIVAAMHIRDADTAASIMLQHVLAAATTLHAAISSVRKGAVQSSREPQAAKLRLS